MPDPTTTPAAPTTLTGGPAVVADLLSELALSLFVVMGEQGEHDDRRTWIAAVCVSEAAAVAYVERCSGWVAARWLSEEARQAAYQAAYEAQEDTPWSLEVCSEEVCPEDPKVSTPFYYERPLWRVIAVNPTDLSGVLRPE